MPSGVAAASWAAQSSARWSTAASKPSRSVSSAHFSGAAGDPDDARAVDLGELAGDRADRAGRGRDDDRLARLRLADVADPDPRGEPGHPERAQVGTRRDALGDIDRQQRHRVRRDRVLLPADETLHGLADRIVRIVRRDDLAEPGRAHDLADADRRQVRRRVVDPRAVRRVERDPVDAHERLAVPDLGHRLLAELEGVRADAPGGALAEEEAAVSIGHERTVPDVVRQPAGPAPEPLAARGPEPAAGPRDQPGPDHCPHPNPRTGRDHEVDPSRQSAEDGDGRSVAGASSASVWAGLNRPVRGIVESWVRAKANSCLAGASGRSAGWPVAWARSRPWVREFGDAGM